jgi:hypothetical protein
MPTYTNTSYATANVVTTGSTIFTVGGSNTVAVTSLLVSNKSASPITADAYITRSATDYYIIKGATVPVGGSLEAIAGNRVVLIGSDALKVATSANTSADCVVSVLTTS